MAFNRLMLTQITISESVGSTGSTTSTNPFFSSESSGSPKFFIGDLSEDECDDFDAKEEVSGMISIPARSQAGGGLLKLSPPSSKLAQRRQVRYNSVSLSPPSSPSL